MNYKPILSVSRFFFLMNMDFLGLYSTLIEPLCVYIKRQNDELDTLCLQGT